MKLLVSLNKKEVKNYLKSTNSFILGLENYSVNYLEFSVDEIKEILNEYPDIEVFVSINKNIFNKELEDLEIKLKLLSKISIKGIFFYDHAILSMVKRLGLNIPLCIHGTHMITNYNICNYYFDKDVEYACLSTEITLEDMLEITHKTRIKTVTYLVGHPIISHSKRHLLGNYFKHYNINDRKELHTINEKNKECKYYVVESEHGTNILTYDILNGTEAFLQLKDKMVYGILDNNLVDDSVFMQVLELYSASLKGQIEDDELINRVRDLIGNFKGFFFTKTIYKVKS